VAGLFEELNDFLSVYRDKVGLWVVVVVIVSGLVG